MKGVIIAKQDCMREITLEWIGLEESVIELGCSNGNYAGLLKIHGIGEYLGIDIQKDKINEARNKYPDMNFVCCNITDKLYILENAKTFVSFQCLEHIKEDLKVLKSLPEGCKTIISVPNRPYRGHVRWFELDGWEKRFSKYIHFDEIVTIQHPTKKNNRAFLFRGVRNGHNN